jgi:hypothetical protein
VIDVTAIALLVRVGGEILALAVGGPIGRYEARFERNMAALRGTIAQLQQAEIIQPLY